MPTLARENRELREAHTEALEQLAIASECLHVALDKIWSLQTVEMKHLRDQLDVERVWRVSAQRGLIDEYHRPCISCGSKWFSGEIGYDPDLDPGVREEIAGGKIPPRGLSLKALMVEPPAPQQKLTAQAAKAMAEPLHPARKPRVAKLKGKAKIKARKITRKAMA